MKRWGHHPALIGYEPVNEPSHTNKQALKHFYRKVREVVRSNAADWVYTVLHDGFATDLLVSLDLFEDWDKVAFDVHGYLAWNPRRKTIEDYC